MAQRKLVLGTKDRTNMEYFLGFILLFVVFSVLASLNHKISSLENDVSDIRNEMEDMKEKLDLDDGNELDEYEA